MDFPEVYTMTEAASMLGVSYMTVYRWVQKGKLKPEKVWGRQLLTLDQLAPYIIKRCSNCYHENHENGIRTCACREISDIADGCPDWRWKWNSKHS